jgi:hypothetical protein
MKTPSRRLLAFAAVLAAALVSALPAAAPSPNLIRNADFSKPLEEGWTTSSTQAEPEIEIRGGETTTIRVHQFYKGYTSLSQIVPVKDLNLEFSFSGWFATNVNKPEFGALAGIGVAYYSADTELLGRTLVYRATATEPLKGGDDLHLIRVKSDSAWGDYALNLNDEVAQNLKAVEPEKVALVRISLDADNGQEEGC